MNWILDTFFKNYIRTAATMATAIGATIALNATGVIAWPWWALLWPVWLAGAIIIAIMILVGIGHRN